MSTLTRKADPKSFLEEHFELPVLPAVVQKLVEQLSSDRVDAGKIAELLAADVGLVAQIMKIVNSAYFGLPHPIRDVKHAVAYLGLAEIKRVALAVFVMESLAPEDTEDFERFWYHSFHTALTAKVVAKNFSEGIDPEELYVSALLHDVGKLVYMKFFPDQYRELKRHSRDHSLEFYQAEERLGYPTHGEFGEFLCDSWSLGKTVRRACMTHELQDLKNINLSELRCSDDIRVICISNALSNLATRELTDAVKSEVQAEVTAALGCDADMLLLMMGEVIQLGTEVDRFIRDLQRSAPA